MRNKVLFMLMAMFFTIGIIKVFAETSNKVISTDTIESASSDTTILIDGRNTVFTKSFSVKSVERLATMYRADSPGIARLRIQLQQSYCKPTIEGLADDSFATIDTLIEGTINEQWTMDTADTLVPLPWARYKITGIQDNDNATTIELKVGKQ